MSEAAPRPRGRPKDPGKITAMLDAARAIFLEHGADGVALDSVIARAGVSKATFYANFADRDALLEAVIRRESARIVPIEQEPLDGDLRDDLNAFGLRLLGLLTDPDIVGFERLIATASRSHPNLAARFYEAGPGRAFAALVARIADAVRAGELRAADPTLAAEDLVGLWQGMMRVEMTMAAAPPPDDPALAARAQRGVNSFLRLYGVAE